MSPDEAMRHGLREVDCATYLHSSTPERAGWSQNPGPRAGLDEMGAAMLVSVAVTAGFTLIFVTAASWLTGGAFGWVADVAVLAATLMATSVTSWFARSYVERLGSFLSRLRRGGR